MNYPAQHRYFTYILTNPARTVLYIGVTNNLLQRLSQHREDATGAKQTFCGKYNCIHILHYEERQWIQEAIAREKELKGWTRAKKMALIKSLNPELRFLEDELF